MNTILVIFEVRSVPISAVSVNCLNGSLRTKRNSWIKSGRYCTGGDSLKNSQAGCCEKDSRRSTTSRGIFAYGNDPEVQGELWDGKMYVFDERISVEINHVDKTVIGRDWFDGTPCERYVNCANPECNRQFLTSEENQAAHLGGCCYECAAKKQSLRH